MPFRTEHSCMVNDQVTQITEIRRKETKWGTLRLVYGTTAAGKKALRSIRIPAKLSVQMAQSLCISRGGQFQPATPINPQKQLLSEMNLLNKCNRKIVFNALIQDFEAPVMEVEMKDWEEVRDALPDSAFLIILPGGRQNEAGRTVPKSLRVLPYKNATGKIERDYVKNALTALSEVKAPAKIKRVALLKLLQIAHALGIQLEEGGKFKMSDLVFYLKQLEKIGEE